MSKKKVKGTSPSIPASSKTDKETVKASPKSYDDYINSPENPYNMGFIPEEAGWIPPENRSVESQKIHEQYVSDTPIVEEIFTGAGSNKGRPRIWQAMKRAIELNLVPKEFVRNGQLKNIAQIIGSCVGFGAGNMLLWSSVIDNILQNLQTRIVVPFVPYHYGRGRLHSGIRGPGSGSFGSGQAKALQLDGYLSFDSANLPKVNFGDSIYWTQDIEYSWSDGAKIKEEYLTEGRKKLVTTVARLTNTDQAAQLADNFYTFTIASSWGGNMMCRVADGVLLNKHVGTWNHQMWVLDYIDHPRLGRLWWIGNNWRYPHGKDPGGEWDGNTGAPEGGFYVTDKDLAWIISKQDSFAFDPVGFEDRSRAFDYLMG